MTCPNCGREVIQATLPSGKLVYLDAAPTPGGTWRAWYAARSPGMPGAGVWHARPDDAEDDGFGDGRALHACEGRAGEQLRLDGAA